VNVDRGLCQVISPANPGVETERPRAGALPGRGAREPGRLDQVREAPLAQLVRKVPEPATGLLVRLEVDGLPPLPVDLEEQDRVVGLVKDLSEPLLALQDLDDGLLTHALDMLEVERQGEVVGTVFEDEELGSVRRAFGIGLDQEDTVPAAVHLPGEHELDGPPERPLEGEAVTHVVVHRAVTPGFADPLGGLFDKERGILAEGECPIETPDHAEETVVRGCGDGAGGVPRTAVVLALFERRAVMPRVRQPLAGPFRRADTPRCLVSCTITHLLKMFGILGTL